MNFNFTLLTFSLLILINSVEAQSSTRTGFIVTQAGDTLRGEIRAKSWYRTPSTILFRVPGEVNFAEYDGLAVQYFEAGGDKYITGNVWIDNRPVDFEIDSDRMLPEYSNLMDKDIVFLRCLVLGSKYDLLQLVDEQKEHYYLRNDNGQIMLLRYMVWSSGSLNVVQHFQFREILRDINQQETNDPTIEEAISVALYEARSLSSIIQKLNNARGKVNFKYIPKPSKKLRAYIGVAGGLTITLPRSDYKRFLKPATGNMQGIVAGLDLQPEESQVVFRLNSLFARVQYNAPISAYGPNNYKIIDYSIIPSMLVRIPLLTVENFTTFLGGGFQIPITLSSSPTIDGAKQMVPSDTKFPWVGITAGGQIDFQIGNKWEIGVVSYMAPAADMGGTIDPMHLYMWVARRF